MNRTTLIRQLAKKAGKLIQDSQLNIELYKKDSIVTQADLASEKLIVESIKTYFPNDNILSEETVLEPGLEETTEYLWVIDPIDGTRNYKLGRPYYCISIALVKNRQTMAGIVHAPALKTTYFAQAGKGATCNHRPIHCANQTEASKCCFATDGGDLPTVIRENVNLLLAHPQLKSMRITGSGALSLCEVAAGKLNLYLHCFIQPWDQAAALLICQEAGCKVSNLKGESADFFSKQILVANPSLHEQFLKQIKQ